MGTYLNPGDSGFRRILSGEYVDKTGIVGLVNAAVGTPHVVLAAAPDAGDEMAPRVVEAELLGGGEAPSLVGA